MNASVGKITGSLTRTHCMSTSKSGMFSIHKDDAFKWNCALRGLLESNAPSKTFLGYRYMRRRSVTIDSHTLSVAIKACMLLLQHGSTEGEQIHNHVFKMGFGSQVIIQTALLKMYGVFGLLVSAQRVFDETPQRDLIQWNALVAAYAQRNQPHQSILMAQSMFHAKNVKPNEVTVVSIASACSQLKALQQGKSLHAHVIKSLLGFDTILHNSLINMYAKCGCMSCAHRLFAKMSSRNVITWTSMIDGYCDNDCPQEAMLMFKEMEAAGMKPDNVTMLAVVSMCAKTRNTELRNWLNEYVEKNEYRINTQMANALIDMHGKCGEIEKSRQVFEQMKVRTVVSWTTMIQALALHGRGWEALVRFAQMQREGYRPDEVVFLNVIQACTHAGLAMEGLQCFKSMVEEHGMEPWMEHYGSIVDLLCRAGLVKDAFEFVLSAPVKQDAVILRTLIGACKDRGDVHLAQEIVCRLLELEPEHGENYVLKSNLHAMVEEWDSVKEVRDNMGRIIGLANGVPGSTSIEVEYNVHP